MTGEGEEARADIDIEGDVGVWRGRGGIESGSRSGWVGGWVFAAARTLNRSTVRSRAWYYYWGGAAVGGGGGAVRCGV